MFVILVLFWVEFFRFSVGCLLCRCLSILDSCYFDINALAYGSNFFFDVVLLFVCFLFCLQQMFLVPSKNKLVSPLTWVQKASSWRFPPSGIPVEKWNSRDRS